MPAPNPISKNSFYSFCILFDSLLCQSEASSETLQLLRVLTRVIRQGASRIDRTSKRRCARVPLALCLPVSHRFALSLCRRCRRSFPFTIRPHPPLIKSFANAINPPPHAADKYRVVSKLESLQP